MLAPLFQSSRKNAKPEASQNRARDPACAGGCASKGRKHTYTDFGVSEAAQITGPFCANCWGSALAHSALHCINQFSNLFCFFELQPAQRASAHGAHSPQTSVPSTTQASACEGVVSGEVKRVRCVVLPDGLWKVFALLMHGMLLFFGRRIGEQWLAESGWSSCGSACVAIQPQHATVG